MAGDFARIVVTVTLMVGCGIPAVANEADQNARCTATAAVPDHIRTTSCEMMRAIALGMSASPSFRRLVERVAMLHGVVYFTAKQVVQSQTLRVIDGTLQHRVTVAGSDRLLFATVTPYRGLRPIPIIAHELQHALEVLESNATSEREIDDLFERIGVYTATRTIETAAALNVQDAVARELANGKQERTGCGGCENRETRERAPSARPGLPAPFHECAQTTPAGALRNRQCFW